MDVEVFVFLLTGSKSHTRSFLKFKTGSCPVILSDRCKDTFSTTSYVYIFNLYSSLLDLQEEV